MSNIIIKQFKLKLMKSYDKPLARHCNSWSSREFRDLPSSQCPTLWLKSADGQHAVPRPKFSEKYVSQLIGALSPAGCGLRGFVKVRKCWMHGDLSAVFEDLPPSCYVENGTSHFPLFIWVAVVTPTCALQLLRLFPIKSFHWINAHKYI